MSLTYSTGTTAGDHKGDDLKVILDAIKTWAATVDALLGSSSGRLAPTALSAATLNDYDPGGGFPTAISWLYLTPYSGGTVLTGLKAGSSGQTVTIQNGSATDPIDLSTGGDGTGDTGSIAANRMIGEGDARIPAGGVNRITYQLLPSPRWVIG